MSRSHEDTGRPDRPPNRGPDVRSVSETERALKYQPIGVIQIRVALICGLTQMCDGYDLASIGWATPSLTHVWQLPPSSFAQAFFWTNLGVLAGALVAGPIGDRVGRKPLLLLSVGLFGLSSLASAISPSMEFLSATRFFTGVGAAGGFTGAVALTGDYAPRHRRAMMITLTFTGGPVGAFAGGLAVSYLLHLGFVWQIIFIIGCVLPLALLAVAAMWLPELPHLLAVRSSSGPRDQALSRSIAIANSQAEAVAIDETAGNPFRTLFSGAYALQTVLLWIGFFCSLCNLYLFIFWLPEVLHLAGMTPARAVFATSLYPLGGIAAGCYLGWAIDRLGTRHSLALHFAVGILFIAAISLVALPVPILLTVVFFAGVSVMGSVLGLSAACGKLYPARVRSTGFAMGTGFGRLGGITAAPIGGYVLAYGLPPTYVFLAACMFAAVAAVATALLDLPGERPPRRSAGGPI